MRNVFDAHFACEEYLCNETFSCALTVQDSHGEEWRSVVPKTADFTRRLRVAGDRSGTADSHHTSRDAGTIR